MLIIRCVIRWLNRLFEILVCVLRFVLTNEKSDSDDENSDDEEIILFDKRYCDTVAEPTI